MNLPILIRVMNPNAARLLSRKYCHLQEKINCSEKPTKYTIKRLDHGDPIFSKAILSVKSKKARMKTGLVALEGKRLIQDALRVGVQPLMIFFTRKDDLDQLPNLDRETQLYKLPYKDMQLWSDLTTCPGIIAFCKKPETIESNVESLPVTVVCDQVREPGNLGAIIRCAAGAGVQKVILTKGCVDLWDCKVLRGASGAHFRLSIISDVTWEEFPNHINSPDNFLLAVNQPGSVKTSLPCYPYYDINYRNCKNTVIVLGGETEGLSNDVFMKAVELNGKAVNIPLSNNVESLNCVSALSIVLFEIKRQLIL